METLTFRRARPEELPRILAMQADVFSGEQGIPSDDIDAFLAKEPICWCAETGGKIYAAAAAWTEGGETHWGRFVVFPAAHGMHIGTQLARAAFRDLFDTGVETIHMDARDATVAIVCGMGGRVVGAPYPFYEGNVTPVVLERSAFLRAEEADKEET